METLQFFPDPEATPDFPELEAQVRASLINAFGLPRRLIAFSTTQGDDGFIRSRFVGDD